jgi:subtilisin-like proprotein convertase family protein
MARWMPRPVTILLVLLLALAAGAFSRPVAVSAQTTFSNPAPIPIPTGPDQADLYPSPIAVSGLSGVITDLDVTLTGLSHTFPADLDILLVGPTGQTALLLSDALAGNDIVNATVTFDDAAPPPSIPLVSDSVRTSYNGGFDPFPGSAPGAPYGVLLAGFNGSDPNGTWNLFVFDDLAGDGGAIDGGWSLTITTAPAVTGVATTLSTAAALTIPASGTGAPAGAPADPYPATIAVSGLLGTIVDVDVTLSGLSHTFPADLDILLVGPGGQHVMLMSDVGNLVDISGVTLTIDDQATAAMLALPLASGTYQPTNVADSQLVDPLPTSAPAGPHGTNLSVFSGTSPNGTWRLFVVDDASVDVGSLSGGWSLTITTTQGRPSLSQLSPNRVPLSSAPQTITIRGANFTAGATVTIGLRTYPATFVSSTELRVSIVPKDVFVAGWLVIPTATVRVTNPGGATSNSLTLSLTL